MTDNKQGFPPRLGIAFDKQLDDFYAPNYGVTAAHWHHCDIWGKRTYQEYLSLSEHEALVAQAKAEVWRDAAKELCTANGFAEIKRYCLTRAQQLEGGKG